MTAEKVFSIGINWGCYGDGLSAREQLRLMQDNGFEATFLASADPALDEVLPLLKGAEIVCEALHAPFRGINGMWQAGDAGEQMLGRLIHGVTACARHEIPVLVVHLSSGDNAPPVNDLGVSRFSRLMEAARQEGVTVAYENQRKLANLALTMELYPDAAFCWDVGHEACFAHGRAFMPWFGDRIAALHLHDNFCEHNGDSHLIPYDGKICMTDAARHLAKSGYSGAVMLEVMRGNSRLYDRIDPETYYRRAAFAARRFAGELARQRTAFYSNS